MLMEELKRQSLSRKECEFIAHKLGFDLTSLNAALHYLRQLNIIAYYDVLRLTWPVGVSTIYDRGVSAAEITLPVDGCSPEVIQTSDSG